VTKKAAAAPDALGSTIPNSVQEGRKLILRQIERYCHHFPKSSLLCAQAARVTIESCGIRQKIVVHLTCAADRQPPLDVQFAIFCMQASLEESYSLDLGTLGVQRYLSFRSLTAQANAQVIMAARCQQRFFAELQLPEPAMERLQAQGVVRSLICTPA